MQSRNTVSSCGVMDFLCLMRTVIHEDFTAPVLFWEQIRSRKYRWEYFQFRLIHARIGFCESAISVVI